MSGRQIDVIIFGLSSTAFLVSLKLFKDLKDYTNYYGISSNLLFGWDRWLVMSLIILFFLGFVTIFAMLKLISTESD